MFHSIRRSTFAFLAVSLLLCISTTNSVIAQGTARKIVYIRNSGVWVMNLDGSAQTQVCNCIGAERPVLSPDGLKIAFEMSSSTYMYVVNVDGTGLINLTPNGGVNSYASWSPDSTEIAFQSDGATGGEPSIYRVKINGSNLTRISFIRDAARPSWSPDGEKIAFLAALFWKGTSFKRVVRYADSFGHVALAQLDVFQHQTVVRAHLSSHAPIWIGAVEIVSDFRRWLDEHRCV